MHKPPNLSIGDKVLIISPSRQINEAQLNEALHVFKDWGLVSMVADNALNKDGYFAGSDQERLSDLQHAFDDNSIKAVFCARGGYGMTRIIDGLDLGHLVKNPKWIIGFSDITALHLLLNNHKIESIHGIMPVQFGYKEAENSILALKKLLFDDQCNITWSSDSKNLIGETSGEIIGGNLSLLADSIGTISELNAEGKILLIEEIDEYYYKIDRMLTQLKRAGKLDSLKGLIVGQFSDLKDTQIKFGRTLEQLVLEKFDNTDIPICFGAPFGHEMPNYGIPIGRQVRLKVGDKKVSLSV